MINSCNNFSTHHMHNFCIKIPQNKLLKWENALHEELHMWENVSLYL